MTTDRRLLALILLLFLAACVTGRSARRGGLPDERVASFPAEVQDSYRLFAAKCSRCHTLSRPLDANITEHEHWDAYVSRMRHHAGSGISKADAEEILVFLYFYADQKAAADRNDGLPPPPTIDASNGAAQ